MMKHYKDAAGALYAFFADGSQDDFIKPGLTQITDAEAAALRQPTAAQIEQQASDAAKVALVAIDMASIRSIREWVVSQPTAPQILKDRDSAAAVERAKVKP